jgi:DNA polymerase-3 subunit delta
MPAALRPEQLDAHLQKHLEGLYVVHGDEPLLALEAADAIRARARKLGFSERSVFSVERSFEWGALLAASAGMSLFGDKKIIELRIPTGKPGTAGSEAIVSFCSGLSDDTLGLVVLPRLDRAGQNSAWFKALSARGAVITIWPVERARLPEWIAGRLAKQKQRASRDTLTFLADSVEGNLLAAHQEIQKLALLLPEGELPFEAVRDAVLNVARYDALKLSEAMLAGDKARLVRMLEGLRAEGEAPPRILWILAEEIRAIARVQEGLSRGRAMADVFREARVWGDARQTLVGRAARRMAREALLAALKHAAFIDRVSKGVARGDTWDELLQLGLRFA